MVNLAHPAHHGHRGRTALAMGRALVKDDFADPAGSADLTAAAAAAATLELYHRCVLVSTSAKAGNVPPARLRANGKNKRQGAGRDDG